MSRSGRKPRTSSGPVRQPARGRPLEPDLPVLALSGVGLLITAWLTLATWTGGGLAFCAEGSGCDIIQQSRWSVVLGLPVALWGFAVYALIALLAWRMPPRLKRWQRLWFFSLLGVAISLYLTAVGILALGAVCAWCLASLATITAIFTLVALRRPDTAPGMAWKHWAMNSGAVALAAVLALHVYYSDLLLPREDPRLTALALHLEEIDARYYGAWWCPSCAQQRRLFGRSADYLPYVECSPDGRTGPVAMACVAAGIDGYPTWIIGGQRIQSLLTPEELARYSGFDWQGWGEG
ncbi:MAG: vitamin K epoxide reductase family protein [Chromatiales bacterium]|nr:vitamin K epoxide reductase family protein [Chromatiales bacterium]